VADGAARIGESSQILTIGARKGGVVRSEGGVSIGDGEFTIVGSKTLGFSLLLEKNRWRISVLACIGVPREAINRSEHCFGTLRLCIITHVGSKPEAERILAGYED
jgi:hypothetical protein